MPEGPPGRSRSIFLQHHQCNSHNAHDLHNNYHITKHTHTSRHPCYQNVLSKQGSCIQICCVTTVECQFAILNPMQALFLLHKLTHMFFVLSKEIIEVPIPYFRKQLFSTNRWRLVCQSLTVRHW